MTGKEEKERRRSVVAMWVANGGLLLIMAGLCLPLLRAGGDIYKYIFCCGAAMTLVGRLFEASPAGVSLRVRRLVRMQLWCAILFCVAAFCMFYRGVGPTDWLAFTLAGGALHVYSSLMLPRAMSRDKSDK